MAMADGVVGVDAHAHVMRRDAPLAAQRHSAPKRDVTVEEYLAVLDRHGVAHGVLTAPSFYGTDNSLLLAALDSARGRLRGTAIVAPDIEREALVAMGVRGVVGVRLNWIRRDTIPDVASPEYGRLFALLAELGWHVEIFLEGAKLATVLPAVRASGVRVVVDHFAHPDPAQRVACAGISAGSRRRSCGRHVGETVGALSPGRRRCTALCRRTARCRWPETIGVGKRLALRVARGHDHLRTLPHVAARMDSGRRHAQYRFQ